MEPTIGQRAIRSQRIRVGIHLCIADGATSYRYRTDTPEIRRATCMTGYAERKTRKRRARNIMQSRAPAVFRESLQDH